ncbi:DEAD/DEAH box helicase [Carboxylicivirga sp. N1Y90]|uniref:DEAD/DEAH box helicase n=1 Tax=Carboxylicivirga fragile TaxID=3417571 RepID=UPI003D343EAD|nr:ATP-dependent DNA helicase RecQ [Marinilabiliaceae bacterium N1Y90]
MQQYIGGLKILKSPSFQDIRKLANQSISHLSRSERDKLWEQLNHGVDLLDSHELMCQYLWSFGNMHEAKIHEALKGIPLSDLGSEVEIVDWGCGQGMATMSFIDFVKSKGLNVSVNRVTLIEPSEIALDRAEIHLNAFLGDNSKIDKCNKYLDDVSINDFKSDGNRPVIHFFSNILDIPQIDLKLLAQKIDDTILHDNYIICVGPLNYGNRRIDAFHDYYHVPTLYERKESQFDYGGRNTCTCNIKIFQLTYTSDGNLIPIEFYPEVQFHAAYQLDALGYLRKQLDDKKQKAIAEFYKQLSCFETATPFDIGASVYDDVHPILAILNNMVTRGLPTKSSPIIEEQFEQAFALTQREDRPNGDIVFSLQKEFDYLKVLRWLNSVVNSKEQPEYAKVDKTGLQLVLSPIAIARLQKTILEAMMTEHLSFDQDEWKVLVEEKDVPCAALAFKDLELLFNKLCSLSEQYQFLKFPIVKLDVISSAEFSNSPLHLDANVSEDKKARHDKTVFDLVIETSTLVHTNIEEDSFSHFKAKNKCYFNIQSAKQVRRARTIYTTDKINYRSLVTKDERGDYTDIEETKSLLEFFLQLLFRKQGFRPGQLPILNRALQNSCVIGLLPTGGGKSLTYQLAALLQPGVTLIVDPLSSLMKDQYDGLITAGIDCCTYINSTVSDKEARAIQMEKSQMLFAFLSPERLAIYNFRKRLQLMHDTHVYFAYGVLDEVHCVSEWGHDFRFSYLHLGRNLYKYVRAKEGNVSLFGLTATASFDVLADVERELSGEGAFDLDSETIVRYENSNRLELQYKVEKVNVEFKNEIEALEASDYGTPERVNELSTRYRDLLDNNLSIPMKISDKWGFYEAKKNYIKQYIQSIPQHLSDIQSNLAIEMIKSSFEERQGNNVGIDNALETSVDNHFYAQKSEYDQAGIIFCPHKAKTGISVQANKDSLFDLIPDVGTFSGGDDEDNSSMKNLELFRDDKQPLMVATKAFCMGIDKPNVRFTVNMNYSSSLESFVQEAGRGGRDRKMALAVILLSDYKLARINKRYTNNTDPLGVIKGRWFKPNDLDEIIKHYNFDIHNQHIDYCTPEKDLVRLFCREGQRPKYFGFRNCNDRSCKVYQKCKLRQVPQEAENWIYKEDLLDLFDQHNLSVDKKHIEYHNADYETVMYFYNNSFKGAVAEKLFMHKLLSTFDIDMFKGNDKEIKPTKKVKGFLSTLISADENEEIVAFVNYIEDDKGKGIEGNQIDIAKAIYRMTCIELIDDFTQDYSNKRYRIVAVRKAEGQYFEGLNRFLLRYYNADRATLELEKAKKYQINEDLEYPIKNEIYRCLAYLTEFVYEKISEKRKRAIDDMRNFCIAGIDESKDWKERNEELKDFIFYYFNSKYAKEDYVADNGEDYSLTIDTDRGKDSTSEILFKYLKVIDDELVGVGTPIDNVKHLQGAVRLIRRSLTDKNPALSLLNAFCLFFLGTNNNDILVAELSDSYKNGLMEFEKRFTNKLEFWQLFEDYNTFLHQIATEKPFFLQLKSEVSLAIHANNISNIATKYTL